ncbi:UNVERIFIED_CONTAM: hypothetical protein FKN15_050802 [Acipenser sinensis]
MGTHNQQPMTGARARHACRIDRTATGTEQTRNYRKDAAKRGRKKEFTEQQVQAFREAFGLFNKNREDCIDVHGLRSSLSDVGISVGKEQLDRAMQSADIDDFFNEHWRQHKKAAYPGASEIEPVSQKEE